MEKFLQGIRLHNLREKFADQWKLIFPLQKENQKFEQIISHILDHLSKKSSSDEEIFDEMNQIVKRLAKCIIQPGDAVGAITAQSLGEPCT